MFWPTDVFRYNLARTVPALGGRPLLIERVGRWDSTALTTVAKESKEVGPLYRSFSLSPLSLSVSLSSPPPPSPACPIYAATMCHGTV